MKAVAQEEKPTKGSCLNESKASWESDCEMHREIKYLVLEAEARKKGMWRKSKCVSRLMRNHLWCGYDRLLQKTRCI